MAHMRKKPNDNPAFQRPRPLSADLTPYSSSPPQPSSMLYSMLPSAVQSRLPRLPSLRRSASMYGLRQRQTRSSPGTPPGGYTNAVVLSGSGSLASNDGAITDYFAGSMLFDDEVGRYRSARPASELSESKSGIAWKFGGQGLSLLGLAVEESSALSRGGSYGNVSFARQLYIHALTYLLRGLPPDLNTEEQLSLRAALPSGIVAPLRGELSSSSQEFLSNSTSGNHKIQQPSLIHRTLASTIVQLFLLFQLALPYMMTVLQTAYKYERTHRMSERIFASSVDTMDSLGRRGLSLTGTMWGLGLGEVVLWFAEGVIGGIQEGVGEGMKVVSIRPDLGQRTRDGL